MQKIERWWLRYWKVLLVIGIVLFAVMYRQSFVDFTNGFVAGWHEARPGVRVIVLVDAAASTRFTPKA